MRQGGKGQKGEQEKQTAVQAFREVLRLLKRNREKERERERGTKRMRKRKVRREWRLYKEKLGLTERGGEESSVCNIASGNVAHYLVAALTICTVDHPQQCLSCEGKEEEICLILKGKKERRKKRQRERGQTERVSLLLSRSRFATNKQN